MIYVSPANGPGLVSLCLPRFLGIIVMYMYTYIRMEIHPLIAIGRLCSISVDGKIYAGTIQLPTLYIHRGTMSEYNAYKAVKIKRPLAVPLSTSPSEYMYVISKPLMFRSLD